MEKIRAEIDKNEALGLIERVHGPTPWVSNIHPVPKPGKPGEFRMTVDMRSANRAIRRKRHYLRSTDDLMTKLNGLVRMTKLDMTGAYSQCKLAPKSRYITVFVGPQGMYQNTRLQLGVNCGSELFQEAIEGLLRNFHRAFNMQDDIFVWGFTDEEHDLELHRVLTMLAEEGGR